MSSWKQYGGINNSEKIGRINAESITTNQLILKKPYLGIFDICGQFNVTGPTHLFDNLSVDKDAILSGNTQFGNSHSFMNVYGENATFYSPVVFNGGTENTGNVTTQKSIIVNENIYLGNIFYFGNGSVQKQFIYGNQVGIGINTLQPNAALDIATNQPLGFNIKSSSATSESVLAQNSAGKAVTLGVDQTTAHIRFYYDNRLSTGNIDASIAYHPRGFLNINVSQNVNVASKMTISVGENNEHLGEEMLTIYDISSGPFFQNIYGSLGASTGTAITMVAPDASSNTFLNFSTKNNIGLSVGGGTYPADMSRSMGTILLQNNSTPTQMYVSGNSIVKYPSTTGINTFQPRFDKYVLDINGPIHLDNGDISIPTGTLPFQIRNLSVAKSSPNVVIGVGSSIDVNPIYGNVYQERLIKSMDYGQTWNPIDISNSFIAAISSNNNFMDSLTSIYLYDNKYCLMTGSASTILFSRDGGYGWYTVAGATSFPFATYNNIFINPYLTSSNNLFCYFITRDNYLYFFAINQNQTTITTSVNVGVNFSYQVTDIDIITSFQANSNAIYVAGNAIVKLSATPNLINNSSIQRQNVHSYPLYSYSQIKVFDNSYVIAVGNNIISSTTNGGITWTDNIFNPNQTRGVNFTSVYIYDSSNAIAVGSYGNIWVTNNQGTNWSRIQNNLINSSGKALLVLNSNNNFTDVIMTDINTILISNVIQPYIQKKQQGISSVYNVFTPNYLNRSNNIVFDISGTINVSGDLKISDGGSIVSQNPTVALFNNTVQNINFGGDATTIILGNSSIGNTIVRNNLSIIGNTTLYGNVSSINSISALNYDINNFPNNYGKNWQDTNNTAPVSSYYNDLALSYDGKYQFGLLYNKYSFGTVTISSNYGSTWSSVPLPQSYTSNIIYQAVPYLSQNNQNFQFSQLNSVISMPNAQPLNIQVGTYIASAFSNNPNAFYAFDNSYGSIWQSSNIYSNGNYTGNSGFGGDYIQIQLPYSFILTNYTIYNSFTGYLNTIQGPSQMILFGSSDTLIWTQISMNTLSQGQDQTINVTNNTPFTSYRFVIPAIFNQSVSPTFAAVSRIDITGLFQNITGSFSGSIASSGTGQYITVTNQGYISGNGNLYISSNYGQSFSDTGASSANAFWQNVAISQTGMYQAAIGLNRSGVGNIWLSSNYGISWSASLGIINGWQSISISSTGQYITAIQSGNIGYRYGNIWSSTNYGLTWGSSQQIYQYVPTVNAFLNQGSPDFNKTIHISTSGQYQTVLGLATTADLTGNANIWINSNYGQGPWIDTGYRGISGNVILSSISVVGTGQYQLATFIGNVYGSYLKSTNYGVTWSSSNYQAPVEFKNGKNYYGFFPKIGASINGKYIVGITKYQDTLGTAYNNTNSTAPNIGNIFISSISTNNTVLSSNYFGSSYMGNVYASHGIQISVPAVNNASIMMGYDIDWNSAYINSADINGQNPIGLNVNGGFVGIGKAAPTVSLDVSGNIYSSGQISASTITQLSDYRIKSQIVPLRDLSYNIDNLEPVFYKNRITNKNDIGFIAHELQEFLPFLVDGDKDDIKMQSVNYNGIIGLLVKEIQDLKGEIRKMMSNNVLPGEK